MQSEDEQDVVPQASAPPAPDTALSGVHASGLAAASRLGQYVLDPIKAAFVGKDEIVDLLGICIVARENLFLFGPPGTAKSAIVQELSRRIDGRMFDYLLTRFTEPNELFGPFDIRKLREGDLVTNTEGMLPEAAIVFLDELLNANSAILNSLLMVLNERIFRRGRETRDLPTIMVVGASNHLPEDEALGALFDRFLLRVVCDNVPNEQLESVLHAGWQFEQRQRDGEGQVSLEQIHEAQSLVQHVDLTGVRKSYLSLINKMRTAGIAVSDRRAVKLQRLIAASAILCNRMTAEVSDLWILRYIWDTVEQQTVLQTMVQSEIDSKADETSVRRHPRSVAKGTVDPERLSRDLTGLHERLGAATVTAMDQAEIRERLTILSGQCQWVVNESQREALDKQVDDLWKQLNSLEGEQE